MLELETKFHPKAFNHGEVPYWGLLLVESIDIDPTLSRREMGTPMQLSKGTASY